MAVLTMRSDRQPVATHGNGFGLFEPFSPPSHLRPVATGCDRSALSEEGPLVESGLRGRARSAWRPPRRSYLSAFSLVYLL